MLSKDFTAARDMFASQAAVLQSLANEEPASKAPRTREASPAVHRPDAQPPETSPQQRVEPAYGVVRGHTPPSTVTPDLRQSQLPPPSEIIVQPTVTELPQIAPSSLPLKVVPVLSMPVSSPEFAGLEFSTPRYNGREPQQPDAPLAQQGSSAAAAAAPWDDDAASSHVSELLHITTVLDWWFGARCRFTQLCLREVCNSL